MAKDLLQKMEETTDFLKKQIDETPDYGIILGSGLGLLAEKIDVTTAIDYDEIPNFPKITVKGHDGKLIFGKLGGKNVVACKGRFHYYEGYSMQEVTFPVRVIKALGADTLFVSNAAGSTNGSIETGHVMFINDHINLQAEHPLRGKNEDSLGPRFPDMLHTYDRGLLDLAKKLAKDTNLVCHEGVYVGLQGPTLETPAEYKYLHIIGGDAVGMSTVPEVIVAKHMNMRVFGVSVITDMGYPREAIKETTHEIVIDVANKTAPELAKLIEEMIRNDNMQFGE